MCPVAALRVLRSVTTSGEAPAVGPVFVGRASHPVALAKTTVAVRLRKSLQAVGVQEWELYAAHSLRRGGATSVGGSSGCLMAACPDHGPVEV
jgi:hypothetical protein